MVIQVDRTIYWARSSSFSSAEYSFWDDWLSAYNVFLCHSFNSSIWIIWLIFIFSAILNSWCDSVFRCNSFQVIRRFVIILFFSLIYILKVHTWCVCNHKLNLPYVNLLYFLKGIINCTVLFSIWWMCFYQLSLLYQLLTQCI